MIVETCAHLEHIAPLTEYHYVGFGGLEFLDFDLFHRQLGITRMTSIEQEADWSARYYFNRPFRTIKMLFGKASEHLPLLSWEGLHIVWLDYTCRLTREVVRDCETVLRSAEPGSVLIVTVNAGPKTHERLGELQSNVGEELVPDDLQGNALAGEWGFARGQWTVLNQHLPRIAESRVSALKLRQFLNFHYRDGTRMQTIGWILSNTALDRALHRCRLLELSTSRTGREALLIRMPVLTRREMTYINRRLPLAPGNSLNIGWLEPDEQADYANLYRWHDDALL